jgi:hypothetical protein
MGKGLETETKTARGEVSGRGTKGQGKRIRDRKNCYERRIRDRKILPGEKD